MEQEQQAIEDQMFKKYEMKDDFLKGGSFVKIVTFEKGEYVVQSELIEQMMKDMDTNDDAFIQTIGFLGVGDQGKYQLFQELLGAEQDLSQLEDEERKGIYLYDKPQIVLDHKGNKIINYIMDVDECVDFKLLSVFPLLCSHLVYVNVNQQIKKEKLEVITKRQTGLLEIFAFFMDTVLVENYLEGNIMNQTNDFDV